MSKLFYVEITIGAVVCAEDVEDAQQYLAKGGARLITGDAFSGNTAALVKHEITEPTFSLAGWELNDVPYCTRHANAIQSRRIKDILRENVESLDKGNPTA